MLPSHAAALETYLTANQDRTFRQEFVLDDEYLKDVRKWMGSLFKPNYATGDLNGDGIADFAVLVHREGKEEWSPDIDVEDRERNEHNPDFPLTLLIFNGQKGGRFRLAFSRDLMGPNAAFIAIETKKNRKTLYYGIFETDSDTFLMVPAGKGYIIEFEKPR